MMFKGNTCNKNKNMNLKLTKQYDYKTNSKNKANWMQQTNQQLQHKTPMIIKQPQNKNNAKKQP